jgi:general secretion pathway protein N
MNRKAWLAAALLFGLTVIVRLPARWALRLAPGSIGCEEAAGSLWHGSCARLQAAGTTIGPVSWSLHALPLLIARIDADVVSTDTRLPGVARLTLRGGGRIDARGLRAQLPLTSNLLPAFPEGWQGQLRLDLPTLSIESARLKSLQGTVDVDSLAQLSPAMAMGSYQLRFTDSAAPTDTIVGSLRDTAGPLSVNGTLLYRTSGEYEINGTVAARPEATPELAKAVEILGEPDAQGRRPFSLAGTL